MPIKLALPSILAVVVSLVVSLVISLAVAADARAAPSKSPVIAALFHNDGEGFTPPAKNAALQALLAKHPALSFTEACGVGDTAEMARQLKRDPKLATSWSGFGWSPLHLAAFSGVPAAVQLLLDHGSADLDARARTRFKNTPLQAALLAGQLATVKLLLERGADPLVRQAHGFTPLQEAALIGRRDLVDALLAAGAELNSRADDGRTAVTEALRGKHPELADYLRSRGGRAAEITADLNATPKD
jgi:Ankyrin repeats (3 copies)/Ankyrin repeat